MKLILSIRSVVTPQKRLPALLEAPPIHVSHDCTRFDVLVFEVRKKHKKTEICQ